MNGPDAMIPLDQYEALGRGCGCVELAGWSRVTVTGADRQAFLNNFCTNDVRRLTPGQSCEAFFTNVKGKILGHGLVTCRDDELVVIGPPGQAAALAAHLVRYVIREDVAVGDTTAERAYWLVAGGEDARTILWATVSLPRDNPANYQWLANGAATVGDAQVRWIGWDLPECYSGLLEMAPSDTSRVQESLISHGATICSAAVFETVRIEKGMPLYGVDFDATNLPQEVGRDRQAISFTKGCYLGQETVARIDALGHVNQQLAGVRFEGTIVPQAGTGLTHAGREVGRVTSATYSPRVEAPLALAMLRRGYDALGTRLESPVGSGEVIVLPPAERAS